MYPAPPATSTFIESLPHPRQVAHSVYTLLVPATSESPLAPADDILARARALAPLIREHADQAERERRLPKPRGRRHDGCRAVSGRGATRGGRSGDRSVHADPGDRGGLRSRRRDRLEPDDRHRGCRLRRRSSVHRGREGGLCGSRAGHRGSPEPAGQGHPGRRGLPGDGAVALCQRLSERPVLLGCMHYPGRGPERPQRARAGSSARSAGPCAVFRGDRYLARRRPAGLGQPRRACAGRVRARVHDHGAGLARARRERAALPLAGLQPARLQQGSACRPGSLARLSTTS